MSLKKETSSEIIERLGLGRHVEGGWFKETYRSEEQVTCPDRPGGERALLTTIHYLLESSEPYAVLHRNKSDIVHFHEGGGVIRYLTLSSEGKLEEFFVGPGYDRQLTVKGGYWKATELVSGEWGMVGEAVSPGFDYQDMEMDDGSWVRENFPQYEAELKPFFKKSG